MEVKMWVCPLNVETLFASHAFIYVPYWNVQATTQPSQTYGVNKRRK